MCPFYFYYLYHIKHGIITKWCCFSPARWLSADMSAGSLFAVAPLTWLEKTDLTVVDLQSVKSLCVSLKVGVMWFDSMWAASTLAVVCPASLSGVNNDLKTLCSRPRPPEDRTTWRIFSEFLSSNMNSLAMIQRERWGFPLTSALHPSHRSDQEKKAGSSKKKKKKKTIRRRQRGLQTGRDMSYWVMSSSPVRMIRWSDKQAD